MKSDMIGKMNFNGMQDFSTIGAPFQDGSGDGAGGLNRLYEDLKGWREVLLRLEELLYWDKPFYPGIIVAITSMCFLLVWGLDLSFLTTLSCFFIIIGILDFLLPHFGSKMTGIFEWGEDEEAKYVSICCTLENGLVKLSQFFFTVIELREKNPRMFVAAWTVGLGCLAWLGLRLDNLLLAYLTVTLSLLLPGLRCQGLVDRVWQPLASVLSRIRAGGVKKEN